MKTTFFNISAFVLLFALMGAGCKKDDEQLLEISPTSNTAVIQKEVEGVEFMFCLLNEKGEPATVFEEGEQITFYFSVKNNSSQDIFFDRDVILNADFCTVYSIDNKKIGTPFVSKDLMLIGIGAFKLPPGKSGTFEVPWMDNRDEWIHSFISFNSTHQVPLPKGSYYTGFTHIFNFKSIKTNALTFKINFECK